MIRLFGRKQRMHALAFRPDGRLLAAAGPGKPVWAWDPAAPAGPHHRLSAAGLSRYVAVGFLPDGRLLAVTRHLQFALTDPELTELTPLGLPPRYDPAAFGGLRGVALSADGTRVFLAGNELWCVRVRQPVLGAGWRSAVPRNRSFFTCVAASPDGSRLATSYHDWTGPDQRCVLAFRDPDTATPLHKADAGAGLPGLLTFSPDGRLVAGAFGFAVRVWDADTGSIVNTRLAGGVGAPVTALAFHPGGRLLAVATADQAVHLIETDGWKPVGSYAWGVGTVVSLAFAPDGLTAAAGGSNGVAVWDLDL